nr:hypothetical protein [Acetatifactor sp.]
PNSPWYQHKMEKEDITDIARALYEDDHVFLIYQVVDFDTRDFLDDYYAEHFPGTSLKVVDTFTSSNGFVYEIIHGENES